MLEQGDVILHGSNNVGLLLHAATTTTTTTVAPKGSEKTTDTTTLPPKGKGKGGKPVSAKQAAFLKKIGTNK